MISTCIVCKQQINQTTVGASKVLRLCWKHDIVARKFYGTRYHLDSKKVKQEILEHLALDDFLGD